MQGAAKHVSAHYVFSHNSVCNWHCNRWVTSLRKFLISSRNMYLKSQTIIQKEFWLVNFVQNLQLLWCKCQQEWKKLAFPLALPVISYHGYCVKISCLMVWVSPYEQDLAVIRNKLASQALSRKWRFCKNMSTSGSASLKWFLLPLGAIQKYCAGQFLH